jgi:hypothetical protein
VEAYFITEEGVRKIKHDMEIEPDPQGGFRKENPPERAKEK